MFIIYEQFDNIEKYLLYYITKSFALINDFKAPLQNTK